MTEEQQLRQKVRAYEAALRDIAKHGTRHDLMPTRMIYPHNESAMKLDEWWNNYFRSADSSVRERAERVLAENMGEQVGRKP